MKWLSDWLKWLLRGFRSSNVRLSKIPPVCRLESMKRVCRYCQECSTHFYILTSWNVLERMHGPPRLCFRHQEEIFMPLWARPPVSPTPTAHQELTDAFSPGLGGERQGDHVSCLQKHAEGVHTDTICLAHNCQSSHAENRRLSFLSSFSVKWVCLLLFQRHDNL